jgi:hypothetical protein
MHKRQAGSVCEGPLSRDRVKRASSARVARNCSELPDFMSANRCATHGDRCATACIDAISRTECNM